MINNNRFKGKLQTHVLSISNCNEIKVVHEYYSLFSHNYSKILSGEVSISIDLSEKTISEIKPFLNMCMKIF